MKFVYGDRVNYTPADAAVTHEVPVKVIGDRVMVGGVAMRRVEHGSGAVWTVREDELTHPDVQEINPDDVSTPVTMTALRCGCNWIVQGHRAMGDTAWCPSHAEHSEVTSACQSYVV